MTSAERRTLVSEIDATDAPEGFYAAAQTERGCRGCAFLPSRLSHYCMDHFAPCFAHMRKDGQNVIFLPLEPEERKEGQ